MKRTLFILCTLSIALTLPARPITEKDLFRFQWAADPQVSPDGGQAAFVRVNVDAKREGYDTALWIVALRGGGAPRPLTNGPPDAGPRWAPDGPTLAFLRSIEEDGKPEAGQIVLLSMGGSGPRA